MSEEEIISCIRDNVKDDENTYLLCDCLENIVTGKYTKYDIQLIVSGLLNLYNKEKEQNSLIKEKLEELNIPMETLIGEFNRLEDLEDDREQLKWRLKEEKENYDKLTKHFIENHISKDKIRDEIEFLKKPREITLIDEKGNSKKVMYEEKDSDTIKVLQNLLEV